MYVYNEFYLADGTIRIRNLNYTITSSKSNHIPIGILEIYHMGEWGAMCNADDQNVASLACRELGYVTGTKVYLNNANQIKNKVWVPYVSCSSDDKSVKECYISYGWSTCSGILAVSCSRKYLKKHSGYLLSILFT